MINTGCDLFRPISVIGLKRSQPVFIISLDIHDIGS